MSTWVAREMVDPWVGDATPIEGRIWLRYLWRPMAFGALEVLTKRILVE